MPAGTPENGPQEMNLEQAMRMAGPWIKKIAVERYGIDPRAGLNQVLAAALEAAPAEDARRGREALILGEIAIQGLYLDLRAVAQNDEEREVIEGGIERINTHLVLWGEFLGDGSDFGNIYEAISMVGRSPRSRVSTEPLMPGQGSLGIEHASLPLLRKMPGDYPPYPTSELQMRVIKMMGVPQVLGIEREVNDMRGIVGWGNLVEGMPKTPGAPFFRNMTGETVDLHWLPTRREDIAITATGENVGLNFVVSKNVLIASTRLAQR